MKKVKVAERGPHSISYSSPKAQRAWTGGSTVRKVWVEVV